jgi:predicted ATPase
LTKCDAAQGGRGRLLTRLIGREPDAAELAQLVEDVPLVTLVGAPGCGKTRLALELARRLTDRYPAGVCVVELAPLGAGCLVASSVATALGINDPPNRSVEDALVEELSRKQVLLVLDNCEHLLDGIAALVAKLVARCPALRVRAQERQT